MMQAIPRRLSFRTRRDSASNLDDIEIESKLTSMQPSESSSPPLTPSDPFSEAQQSKSHPGESRPSMPPAIGSDNMQQTSRPSFRSRKDSAGSGDGNEIEPESEESGSQPSVPSSSPLKESRPPSRSMPNPFWDATKTAGDSRPTTPSFPLPNPFWDASKPGDSRPSTPLEETSQSRFMRRASMPAAHAGDSRPTTPSFSLPNPLWDASKPGDSRPSTPLEDTKPRQTAGDSRPSTPSFPLPNPFWDASKPGDSRASTPLEARNSRFMRRSTTMPAGHVGDSRPSTPSFPLPNPFWDASKPGDSRPSTPLEETSKSRFLRSSSMQAGHAGDSRPTTPSFSFPNPFWDASKPGDSRPTTPLDETSESHHTSSANPNGQNAMTKSKMTKSSSASWLPDPFWQVQASTTSSADSPGAPPSPYRSGSARHWLPNPFWDSSNKDLAESHQRKIDDSMPDDDSSSEPEAPATPERECPAPGKYVILANSSGQRSVRVAWGE